MVGWGYGSSQTAALSRTAPVVVAGVAVAASSPQEAASLVGWGYGSSPAAVVAEGAERPPRSSVQNRLAPATLA